MRKLLLTVALLFVVNLITQAALPKPAAATETCTAACQAGASITCTVSSGTCTYSPGSVTCCGATHTCAAINAYNSCMSSCSAGLLTCIGRCPVPATHIPCQLDCDMAEHACQKSCGDTIPATGFSC